MVTSLAAALLGWAGPTQATARPGAAEPATSAVSAAAHTAAAAPATQQRPAPAKPGATAQKPPQKSLRKPLRKPQKPAALSAAKVKALRATAATRAAASAPAKDIQATSCGGPLALDTVRVCASIADGASDTYTVTTAAAGDVLTVQLASTGDGFIDGVLTGPDGTDQLCSPSSGPTACPTGPAGTYTLVVTAVFAPGSYTLAVSSLKSSPCTALAASDLAFDSAPLTGSLAAGAASSCYALGDGAGSGDLLRLGSLPYELQGTVYDANGTEVCGLDRYVSTCALTGDAPYRMLLRDILAQAVTYSVAVNRLSHPSGCAALAPAPFGDPGSAVVSGTVPLGGAACRTVALPAGPVLVSLHGDESTSTSASWSLLTAQGTQVCGDTRNATCTTLPGAGTYTLLLGNTSTFDATPYVLSLVPLTATSGCAATAGTAYDLPLLHRTLGSPVQTDCQPFTGTAGDRIDLTATTDSYGDVTTTIVDPSGAPSCSTDSGDGSEQDGCVLTGSGPYRAITRSGSGYTGTYTLRVARLSDPAGCTPLAPQAYGTAPAGSPDPCWLLQVPAAGTYDVGGTGVYHQDGTRFCRKGAASCTFPAAGTYAMVFRPDYLDDTAFSPVFMSPTQTAGCVAGSDTGFGSGPVSVDLTAAGRRDCLTLPTASGNGLYLAATSSDGGWDPVETVYDAKGVSQCENEYRFAVCKLTGTAPFRVVLTAPHPGVYGLVVQRTGDAAGCAAWPQSPFGGSTGTQVELTADRQTACLALPASGHATAEMFDYTNTANRVNASVRVYDAAGDQVCSTVGSSTTTCRFTAGTGYTAVLVGTSGADTYHLVRRDVSATAACAAPSTLTVGGQSTGYTFTSALDSRCLRVEAAATDKLWLAARTPDAATGGTVLLVVDATGEIVCWQQGASCRVSGSASYVVAVLASGYAGTPIPAHVDTWRVGTASGWVPQCTDNSLSPDGFAPRGGSLTETATAFCGVMQVKPRQAFDVYMTDSDAAGTPALGLYSGAGWNGTGYDYAYQCVGNGAGSHYGCQISGSAAATQVVFLLSPGNTSPPVQYTMQGVCSSQCTTPRKAADVTSVAPASGPTGADNQVVVHGSNLTLGTEVALAHDGQRASDYLMAAPVSVSADGTALTVLLSTRDVAPGTYDVVLDSTGYTAGTRSTGYLPGGYTVTAALSKGGGPAPLTTEPAWLAAFLHNRPHPA